MQNFFLRSIIDMTIAIHIYEVETSDTSFKNKMKLDL